MFSSSLFLSVIYNRITCTYDINIIQLIYYTRATQYPECVVASISPMATYGCHQPVWYVSTVCNVVYAADPSRAYLGSLERQQPHASWK